MYHRINKIVNYFKAILFLSYIKSEFCSIKNDCYQQKSKLKKSCKKYEILK